MNSKYEKRLLRTVLDQLDQLKPVKPRNKALDMLVGLFKWIVVFCASLAYFQYGGAPHWRDAILGLACLGIGYVFAYRMYKSMYARQWPIISSYFDRALIEQRLRELGA